MKVDTTRTSVTNWLSKWPIWILLITISVTISWAWNFHTLEKHTLSLALERGRYTFKIIQATRLWVAQHGVAYVARSNKTPSNPYLEIPEKNITTPSGVKLTAVNPAYMTRQLTEILKNKHDLFVHLTSLNPLNPNNEADPWEAQTLTQFQKGTQETIELIQSNNDSFVRYMAPLFVKPACMKCHEKQGYEIGDVRGGISVSFDFAPFLNSTTGQQQNIHFIHIAAWLLLSIFTVVTLKLIRRHEVTLENARDDAELLVEQKTQELRDEVQIRRSAEAKMQLLLNTTEEGIFGIDHQGLITFMNPAGLHILGYTSSRQVIGRNEHEAFHYKHPNGTPFDSTECQIHAAWNQGLSGHSEDEVFWRTDGTCLAIEYHVHPLLDKNEIVGAVVNFSDISVRKMLQETIWSQANFDNLTGIANRALLLDRLNSAIEQSRRGAFKLAVLYIDLDEFKPVNDKYGHEAGDEVLRSVANRIKDTIRKNDTVARIGGDEFIVILNQVETRTEADDFAIKLAAELNKPIDIGPAHVEVGVSIGISLFPEDSDDMDILLAKADQAMYQIKDANKQR